MMNDLDFTRRALSNNDPSILREIGKNESRNGSIVDKEIGKEELKTTSEASSTSLESISNPSLSPLRAGTRTIIGGKAYIAVPIDRFAVDSFEETTTITGEPTPASVSFTSTFPTITSTTTTSTSTIPTEPIKLTQSKKPNKRKYPSNLDFELPDEICHAHLRITSKKERFL
ncbi:unnamed protein product, partial [Mesorhabditis belari]|uniref:Uncharacterized protein n=1 Tax=Mesorhabditis belari TaxID=2138241 RepID=A0AAF3ENB4_9BILA